MARISRAGTGPAAVGIALDHVNIVTRDVQRSIEKAFAASGDHGLRPSFAPLLQLVDAGPVSVGRIAGDLGVSAQAVSRSTSTLERLGYVERVPSEEDRRSRLISLTDRGRTFMELATDTFVAREAFYASLIGRAGVVRIVRDLDEVCRGLGVRSAAGASQAAAPTGTIGEIVLVALFAREAIVNAVASSGHVGVRTSHLEMLGSIGPAGGRVSTIARMRRVSRQAVSTLAQELEKMGYLERFADDADGRGVVFKLTGRGDDLAASAFGGIAAVEARCRAVLGDTRWSAFVKDLGRLHRALVESSGDVESDSSEGHVEALAHDIRRRYSPVEVRRLAILLGGPDDRRVDTTRSRTRKGASNVHH